MRSSIRFTYYFSYARFYAGFFFDAKNRSLRCLV